MGGARIAWDETRKKKTLQGGLMYLEQFTALEKILQSDELFPPRAT